MNALVIGILLPLVGTMLGSAFVFFMKKDMPALLQKVLLQLRLLLLEDLLQLLLLHED